MLDIYKSALSSDLHYFLSPVSVLVSSILHIPLNEKYPSVKIGRRWQSKSHSFCLLLKDKNAVGLAWLELGNVKLEPKSLSGDMAGLFV